MSTATAQTTAKTNVVQSTPQSIVLTPSIVPHETKHSKEESQLTKTSKLKL